MDRSTLAQRIYAVAMIRGSFRLRSGKVSGEYFDKYLFESQPELLRATAEQMAALTPGNAEAFAGLELGGVPVATVLSQITNLPTVFVRKAAKDYGTTKLVEGGAVAGRRIVVIEDVVTSGGQVIESAHELRKLDAIVSDVLCVIDRESGGIENLQEHGLKLHSLFTASELKALAQT